MPVSFSYLNFPNLWDDILAQTTDGKTTLTLRRVCKALRDVIDRREAQHIVLDDGGSSFLSVASPRHRFPGLSIICPDTLEEDRQRKPAMSLMEHTRTVDIRGFIVPITDVPKLAPLFPNLKTVRITTGVEYKDTFLPYIPFKAETLVLFMNERAMSGIYHHYWYTQDDEEHAEYLTNAGLTPEDVDIHVRGPRLLAMANTDEEGYDDAFDFDDFDGAYNFKNRFRPLAPDGMEEHRLPDGYRKIVVNLNGLPQRITKMFPFVLDGNDSVEEIVIVVPQITSAESLGEVPSASQERSYLITMVILEAIDCARSYKANYTIVGIDRLGKEYERLMKNELREHFSHRLFPEVDLSIDDEITLAMDQREREAEGRRIDMMRLERKMEGKPCVSMEDMVDDVMSRIEMIPVDAYRMRVGAETAAIETVEYGKADDYDVLKRKRDGTFREWSPPPGYDHTPLGTPPDSADRESHGGGPYSYPAYPEIGAVASPPSHMS